MESTSVNRSSAVRESKRVSSRRSLKPRQNFSPEPVRKKTVPTSGRRFQEGEEEVSPPAFSTLKFLDQMSKMEQLRQVGGIPQTEFLLPSWYLEDEDLFGGTLAYLEEDQVSDNNASNDYRDHRTLVRMAKYSSQFIETIDNVDDSEDDVDDILEEKPGPEEPATEKSEPLLSASSPLKFEGVEEEVEIPQLLLLPESSALDIEPVGSDEDNKPFEQRPAIPPLSRPSKRVYKQITTIVKVARQQKDFKPVDLAVQNVKEEKEEVPPKKKKLISKKNKMPIATGSSLASGRPQRNRRQPMQMNDFYCPTFSLSGATSKAKLPANTIMINISKKHIVKQETKIKSSSPETEQQEAEALVPELISKRIKADTPKSPIILVSPVQLNEVAAALARTSLPGNRLMKEVECEDSIASSRASSSPSSVQWVDMNTDSPNKHIELPNELATEINETEKVKDTDSDSVILIDVPAVKTVVKEKFRPVERANLASVRPVMKINYTKMLKKRGILPQSSIAANFRNKNKKNKTLTKNLSKKPRSPLVKKLSSSRQFSANSSDDVVILQPPEYTAVTPVHLAETEEVKESEQPLFATPSTSSAATPLSPAKSITGRPQRHRSTPHSTDFYYPCINPTSTGSSIKLPLLLTARQNASISNTKASPESAPVVMGSKATPGLGSPLASTSTPSAPPIATVLSPKRKNTDNGVPGAQVPTPSPTAMRTSLPKHKIKKRKEYTRRPGPISYQRPSALTPNHRPVSLHLQRKSLAEPLSINICNNSSSNRSSASRQLLSASSTANNTPVMSPKLQQSALPRYSIYGAIEAARNNPLNFFQRMQERKKLNVLAIGLSLSTTYKQQMREEGEVALQRERAKDYPEEYFYKEILVRADKMNEPPKSPTSEEEEGSPVDVDGLESSQFPQDEVLSSNPAEACARDVLFAVKSKFAPMEAESWEENEVSSLEETSDRETEGDLNVLLVHSANQEPKEVQEHLGVLLKYIFVQRLTDISTQQVVAGTSLFYSNSLANANRLRESLKLYNKQRLASILTAHNWLLERLNVYLLAAYLNLLRFLKVAGSGLSEHLAKESFKDKHRDFGRANEYIKDFLAPKIYDPPTNSLSKIMSCDPLKNVSLVLVYPQITCISVHSTSVRPYESIFRNLLPRVAQCVEKVDLALNAADLVSIESCTLQCLHIIQKRVREIVKRRPNDHIFLAGWGTSCLLNHKVVSTVPGVSGLLNFSFPVDSAAGPRGDVEDEICLTYCPSLFVVGENAADVNFEALQSMRKNMIVDSGLIVVGAANHNLFVSQLRLNIERISQKCVERTIVEHTVDFMKQVMTDLGPQSSKECREMLKPVTLQNIYEVDIGALRCRPNPPVAGVPRARKNQTNPQTGLKQSLVKAFDAKPHSKSSTTSNSHLKSLHVQSISSVSSFHVPQQPSPLSLQSYGPITSKESPLNSFGPSPPARPAPLLSARTSLNSSLKKVSDPLRIPTPSMLNQQLPPPMPTEVSSMILRDEQLEQLRRQEEQEAAAAIMDII